MKSSHCSQKGWLQHDRIEKFFCSDRFVQTLLFSHQLSFPIGCLNNITITTMILLWVVLSVMSKDEVWRGQRTDSSVSLWLEQQNKLVLHLNHGGWMWAHAQRCAIDSSTEQRDCFQSNVLLSLCGWNMLLKALHPFTYSISKCEESGTHTRRFSGSRILIVAIYQLSIDLFQQGPGGVLHIHQRVVYSEGGAGGGWLGQSGVCRPSWLYVTIIPFKASAGTQSRSLWSKSL